MKRRQRRPVLELNKTQTGSHGEFLQSKDKYKQIPSDCPVQNVPANPLANLLCHYNSDSDTEDTKKDICKLDDQVNNFFKEIQLIAPKEPNPVDPNNCGVIPNAAVQSAQHLNQQGIMWRECLDESSGYPYYWHIETNEVTWEMPDELQFFKNNAKMSSAVKSTPTQDSHWVDFSSIAYQQSHENIPEGMIPREVVARNRNRYIQKETVRKQDTQTDQDAANTSDAMDDDSDDGKIEMITSYGSDESDSDTTENNQSHNEIQSVSTPESANTNTTIKVKSAEILPMLAPKSLPRVSKRSKKSNQECEKRSSIGEARIEVVLDKKLNDEKDTILRLKNQGKALKRSIDEEVLEYASKGGIEPDIVTVEENITKKHTTKKHVDSELDFRISLVPGYDEDSDPDEEPEVKEERKTLFPIPQNEDTLESVSSLHRSSILQGKQITVDDNRVTDSNDSDTNMDSVGKKNVESQDDDGSSEKLECGEESCVKMEDDAQKTNNKFLESLRGRNKCFQRKKRIAFDVPAAKIKDSDDSETTKVETEPQHGEVNLRTDAQHDVELLKESHIECQKEPDNANDNTTEGIKTHLKEELNTEEQSNPQVDTPALSKDGEEEVNSLSQIILEKLKFLSEGKQSVSPVQMMAIQLQTLFVAWEGGFLEKNYLRRWLTDTGHELERLEQDAAPPGWLCQWDRSHKRYYYQNATTGVTQWTYPDTGIAGGTEEMEICSTPPPAEQEEITASVEAEKSKSKPKNSKEDDDETNGDTTDPRSSDIEAPPPPQISNPSPPPPPRIYAEDLKKDKRKRDKCGEILDNKKKRSGEETTMMMDAQQLDNPAVSAHLSTPLSPQSSTIPNINNAEPLPPGVDLTEASYEIPATALKRIIYSTVQPQGNSLYDTSPRDPAVPILGHPAAIVQEHYLQYPAYHQHLHAPAALVLPHKHGVQPAIQLIPDYTPIYANHKVIEKPPVKTAKESLVSALDSFYSDIARIESSVPEKVSQRQEISSTEASSIVVEEVKMDVEQEPVPVESTVKEKKRKKTRIGISKKHKEVSSMVAKWQKAQQNFEDNT